jgi:hypothetical protein
MGTSHGGNPVVHHQVHGNASKLQGDEFGERDFGAGKQCAQEDGSKVKDKEAEQEDCHRGQAVKGQSEFAGHCEGQSEHSPHASAWATGSVVDLIMRMKTRFMMAYGVLCKRCLHKSQ